MISEKSDVLDAAKITKLIQLAATAFPTGQAAGIADVGQEDNVRSWVKSRTALTTFAHALEKAVKMVVAVVNGSALPDLVSTATNRYGDRRRDRHR